MDNKFEERIKDVLANVFGISIEIIQDNTSPDNISTWDSLNHINMIVEIEEEFQITLSEDSIMQMNNYALIKTILINEYLN